VGGAHRRRQSPPAALLPRPLSLTVPRLEDEVQAPRLPHAARKAGILQRLEQRARAVGVDLPARARAECGMLEERNGRGRWCASAPHARARARARAACPRRHAHCTARLIHLQVEKVARLARLGAARRREGVQVARDDAAQGARAAGCRLAAAAGRGRACRQVLGAQHARPRAHAFWPRRRGHRRCGSVRRAGCQRRRNRRWPARDGGGQRQLKTLLAPRTKKNGGEHRTTLRCQETARPRRVAPAPVENVQHRRW
jgi:hypothetical protein